MVSQWLLLMLTILIGIIALLVPQLVVLTDCLILGHVLKTTEWPIFNGTATAPYQLGDIQYKFHDFRIKDFAVDESFLRVRTLQNAISRLEIFLNGLKLNLHAKWEYNGSDWFGGKDNGNLTIKTSENMLNFTMDLIQYGKLKNTNISVSACAVKVGNINLEIEGKQNSLYETIAPYAKDSLRDYLKDSTCSKVKEKIENEGNALMRSLERTALKLVIAGDKYLTLAHVAHGFVASVLVIFLVLISFFGIGFMLILVVLFCLNIMVLSAMYINRIKTTYRLLKAKAGFSTDHHEYLVPFSKGFAAKTKSKVS